MLTISIGKSSSPFRLLSMSLDNNCSQVQGGPACYCESVAYTMGCSVIERQRPSGDALGEGSPTEDPRP